MKYIRTTTASRRAAKTPPKYLYQMQFEAVQEGSRTVIKGIPYITEEGKARMLANRYQ